MKDRYDRLLRKDDAHRDRMDNMGKAELPTAPLEVGMRPSAFMWDEALFCLVDIYTTIAEKGWRIVHKPD